MANETAQAESAIATYRVLRELGRRSQRSYAVARGDGSLLVLHRFARVSKADATLVTAEEMAILLRDARCLAKNWHPNIARVRHVDLGLDMLEIATELVEGVTLEELLALARARRVHPDEPILSHAVLARIFLDVLAGLSALHSLRDGIQSPLGAFHGELCPANVVVGKDGVARIVSVFRPRPVTITARSEGLGYASPETIAAEVDQDGRVDIYAVGVMLWEALMEQRLYDETTPSRIAQRQREEDIPSPNARLSDVAMRALAFDPALRYRAAQDMTASIRALAGTVAQGSFVAQLVNDLAGDRIRARRAELDPLGRHRSLAPPARSGSYARAVSPTLDGRSEPASAMTPSVPPVPPPTIAGAVRFAVPSAPDVETSYAARAPAPRHALAPPAPPSRQLERPSLPPRALPLETSLPPESLPPPSSEDDDALPGPRESTPDNAYLEQLAAAIQAGHQRSKRAEALDVADLVEDDDIDGNALTTAREVSVALGSMAMAPPPPPTRPYPLQAEIPLADESAPSLPAFPELDRLTAPLAPPPASEPVAAPAAPDSERQPSTRTPFVVDVVPEIVVVTEEEPAFRPRRRIPLAIAAAALVLLAVGAAILARSSQEEGHAPTTAAPDAVPPSTVVVAPPPAVDPVPPAPSATHSAPAPGSRAPAKK